MPETATTLIGIDPSLTACGVAILRHPSIADTPNRPELHTIGEAGRKGASTAERALRLRRRCGRGRDRSGAAGGLGRLTPPGRRA